MGGADGVEDSAHTLAARDDVADWREQAEIVMSGPARVRERSRALRVRRSIRSGHPTRQWHVIGGVIERLYSNAGDDRNARHKCSISVAERSASGSR